MGDEILELKKRLYLALLGLAPDEMTEAEIKIMYAISKDPDIQQLINKALEKK